MKRLILLYSLVLFACSGDDSSLSKISLSPHVTFHPGPVNSVVIEKNGHRLVVYGDPFFHVESADFVLFTHGRRDVVWAGKKSGPVGRPFPLG
jgi:hypothetical protein